jgi:hypothetical protein
MAVVAREAGGVSSQRVQDSSKRLACMQARAALPGMLQE